MPLDADVAAPIARSALHNDPAQSGPIHAEIDRLCADRVPGRRVQTLPGADLYPRIRAAHTIVATSEPALYANVILRKGVIAP
jgi:L-fucose mutarotase